MGRWEKRAAEYRLQQMRAHQLREDPPVPVVRERKPRVWLPNPWDIGPTLRVWTITNDRRELYEAALGG